MKNLKRALCLVLAFTMLLGVMVISTGAANFTDQDEIVNTEAVGTMAELNIINGKPDGTFDPSGIVTRAEMCKMICVALNGGKDPQLGTAAYSYTDTVGNWAAGYIEYCTNLGIVNGRGNGIFDPNGTVTGTEAAKMLLVAIGYDAEAEGFTGASWAMAVNVRANQKDLYDELDGMDVAAGLTRDNAAQMVYNAIQAVMVTYEYKLTTVNGTLTTVAVVEDKSGDPTILSDKYKVTIKYGILTSVDGDNLAITADATRTDSVSAAYTDVGTDYSALLGQYVKVMAKASDKVIGVVATEDNATVSTAISGITANDAKVKFGGTSYTLNNGTSGQCTLIKVAADGTVTTATATVTDFTTGNTALYDNVKFVDNDNDGYYEYAVQTVIAAGKVTYSSSDEIILGGETYDRTDDNVASGLAKNDYGVVSYNLFNENYDVAEITKGTATVSVNSDASKYKLDGTWYYKGTGSLATADSGDDYDFYACNGVIVHIEASDSTASADGVVMVVAVSSGTITEQAKILKSDGTKAVVNVSDDTTDAPVAGHLYTYSVADDGYDFVDAASFGDYAWVASVADDVIDTDSTTNTNHISALGVGTTYSIDDGAVVYLYNPATSDGKIITGKQLKTLNADTAATTANYVYDKSNGFFTSSVSGLTRATVVGVSMNAASTLPTVGSDAKLYALIVDSAYQVDSDYIEYQVWTGTKTVTVQEKKVSALSARPQFTVIKYSSITDGVISDVEVPVLTATPSGASDADKLYVAPVVGLADDELWPNTTTSAGDLDSDTVYMCYDSSTTTAKDIGKPAMDLVRADKSVDDTTYIPNVKYIVDGDGDVVFVLMDVKNAAKDDLTRGVIGVAANKTSTANTTIALSKTSGVLPGEAITVTVTVVTPSSETITLTNAVCADGSSTTISMTGLAAGTYTYTIYSTGAGAITVVAA